MVGFGEIQPNAASDKEAERDLRSFLDYKKQIFTGLYCQIDKGLTFSIVYRHSLGIMGPASP